MQRDQPRQHPALPQHQGTGGGHRGRRTGLVVGLVLTGLVLLAGLGLVAAQLVGAGFDDDDSGGDGAPARPVPGSAITGDGYAFAQPDRASEVGGQFRGKDTELLHALTDGPGVVTLVEGGFVVVERSAPVPGDLHGSVQGVLDQITASGGRAEQIGQPLAIELAGQDAVAYEFVVTGQTVELRGSGVSTIHSGRLYSIVATSPASTFGTVERAMEEVTTTWRWR
jgi:hypothetical protein